MNSNQRLEKLHSESKDFYVQIKSVHCHVLNNELVVFTAAGLKHLIRKGRILRSEEEQTRRLLLLPYAVTVLESRTAQVVFRPDATADFWKITERIGDCLVKVVVRQKKNGVKHFFSIMDNKISIKKSPEREVL